MSATQLLRLEAPDSHRWTWQLADPSSAPGCGRGTLAEAAAAAQGRRVVLLIPGPEVLISRVQVPARNRSKVVAAVPWALEDRLISDVESLHFALGALEADDQWPVAVIARERLDAYLEAVRAAGIEPVQVVPEPLALPEPGADAWTVLEEPGRITVRADTAQGFAGEAELLPGLVAGLAPPDRLTRYRARAMSGEAWPQALGDALAASPAPEVLDEPIMAFDASALGIDLRQGDYSRRQRMGRVIRQWRTPAALAGACLVLVLAQAAVEYVRLGQREAALRSRMEQIFRETFPDVQRVVDPRAQMQTRLESLRSGGDGARFSQLLARAAPALTGSNGVTLKRVRWRQSRLELQMQAKDLQVLDALRKRLAETGLNVELERAERQGDQVAGRIQITEGEG